MKIILTFLLLTLINVIRVNAQKPILVIEDSVNFGKGIYPGVLVNIPDANFNTVKVNWMDLIQTKTKSKVVEENGEISIFGANIRAISKTPVNIYSRLINRDTVLQLSAIFELKKDVYIEKSNGENELIKAKSFLKEFAKNQYINIAKTQLWNEEKILKEMKKELESLHEGKLDFQKDILSNRNSIKDRQKSFSIQNIELNSLKAEIIAQNNQLIGMEKGTLKGEKEKYIKSLEKREKELKNEIESLENKINKENVEIENLNIEIQKNDMLQESASKKITLQEIVVNNYINKLNRIKKY